VGKTAEVEVIGVQPEMVLGYTLDAGKHLNFITEKPSSKIKAIEKGDTILVKITKSEDFNNPLNFDSEKSYLLGYELLDVKKGKHTAQSTASETSTTVTSTDETTPTSSSGDASRWNPATKTFTADDATIAITSIDQTTDLSGKPALKINFSITNNTKTEQNVGALFMEIVTVQQHNATTSNDLSPTTLDTNGDDGNMEDNLNPGATISGYYAVALEDTKNPVILSFENVIGEVEGTLTVTPQ